MTKHETSIDGISVDLHFDAVELDLDALETIADWKDDLCARLRRTELIFMFADADVDFAPLAAEVAEFKKCCRSAKSDGLAV